MKCPHCNAPQRPDYLLEFQCGSQRQVRGVTRSDECHGNEIAQLKAKVKRLEEVFGKMEPYLPLQFVAEWNQAKATP
jgi:hypothetical protein